MSDMRAFLVEVEKGNLKPVIDSEYPLTGIADAHRRLERSEHFGKIILNVEH